MRVLGWELTVKSPGQQQLERRLATFVGEAPPPSDECRAGRHDVYEGTGARGFVHFTYCRRRGCDFRAIRKGAA